MVIEFYRPLLLLLFPAAAFIIWLLSRKVGSRRKSRKLSLSRALHIAVSLLLVLSLASPTVLSKSARAATWALLDMSASSAGKRDAIEAAMREGLAKAPSDLLTGSITFGQTTAVDAPLAQGRSGMPIGTQPDASGTDIGRALQMAMALLPEDAAGRIALVSDGRDNAGNVSMALDALAARGIAVDVLPMESGFAKDVQISRVTPPALVYQHEAFDVTVDLYSLFDTEGTLVLYANRQPIATRDVTIRKGENAYIFRDTADTSGVVTYEAELIAKGDENPRNNRLGAYMDVRGKPQILVVGEDGELQRMLRATGMEVETLLPAQLPESAEALRHYHAIALNNVPIDDLSNRTLEALSDYARKLGRGVAVFGGDDSYALGGWRGTPLEDMLPVSIDVRNQLDMPSLSLMLVIDKSGSMAEGRYGITRLDMAKEAAMRTLDVLTPQDTIGVIAFDELAKWVVSPQKVTDIAAIEEMIGTIVPGGGTAFYSPLAQALEAQVAQHAQLKHIIFLTDGEAADRGHEQLIEQMAAFGISLTTVAVGGGANTKLLSKYAELGKGRAYVADEFDDIPRIFAKETYIASESFVQNRRFTPVIWTDSTLTRFAGYPQLDGYLATTAKPLSTLSMVTDRNDPLLAWWQYGAGRVLAWTSDVQGAWSSSFLAWDEAAAFFSGLLSHILPKETGEGELTISRDGQALSLVYEVDDTTAGLATTASVLTPSGKQQIVTLAQTAPGVYEGTAAAEEEGAYAVRVEQKDQGKLLRTLESGMAVGYSREYDLRVPGGMDLLSEIAQRTGGRVLDGASELFTTRGTQAMERHDMRVPLLIAALLLFLLDVAQRRIAWDAKLPERAQPQKDNERKGKGNSKKPKAETAKPPKAPADTGDQLLERRKKKLM